MPSEYFTRPDKVRGFVMSFMEARCAVSSQRPNASTRTYA